MVLYYISKLIDCRKYKQSSTDAIVKQEINIPQFIDRVNLKSTNG